VCCWVCGAVCVVLGVWCWVCGAGCSVLSVRLYIRVRPVVDLVEQSCAEVLLGLLYFRAHVLCRHGGKEGGKDQVARDGQQSNSNIATVDTVDSPRANTTRNTRRPQKRHWIKVSRMPKLQVQQQTRHDTPSQETARHATQRHATHSRMPHRHMSDTAWQDMPHTTACPTRVDYHLLGVSVGKAKLEAFLDLIERISLQTRQTCACACAEGAYLEQLQQLALMFSDGKVGLVASLFEVIHLIAYHLLYLHLRISLHPRALMAHMRSGAHSRHRIHVQCNQLALHQEDITSRGHYIKRTLHAINGHYFEAA